jgi:hypothetical protein
MANAPSSAGTSDTRVDRPEEGLPGVATKNTGLGYPENPTANPPTRASFDAGEARGSRRPQPKANIDTSGTSGLTPDADVKRGEPGAWA